jgi:hypothetical protein
MDPIYIPIFHSPVEDTKKEIGLIYLKVVPPKSHKSEWVKYCHVKNIMPKNIQLDITKLVSEINSKYNPIVEMDNKIHPGCAVLPTDVEKVASEMYLGFVEIFKSKIDAPCVRCVYTIGSDVVIYSNSSLHNCSGYDIIKLGRFLDSSDEAGIFKL